MSTLNRKHVKVDVINQNTEASISFRIVSTSLASNKLYTTCGECSVFQVLSSTEEFLLRLRVPLFKRSSI